VRLLPPVQPALVHAIRALARQRRLQAVGGELPPYAQHGARVDVEGAGDRGVGPARAALAVVGLQQDAGAGQ
jgi:hypothetical protein